MADVELACRVVFGQASNHVDVPPVPYRDVKLPERLRFGYYTFGQCTPPPRSMQARTHPISDGFVKSSPAAARAVQETVEALRRAGHECVEFAPPDSM